MSKISLMTPVKALFNPLCKRFNPRTRIKESAAESHLYDNTLHGEYKILLSDGSTLLAFFEYKRNLVLHEEHILNILKISNDIFSHYGFKEDAARGPCLALIEENIEHFAKILSVVPASAVFHDEEAGGLFFHSLLTLKNMLSLHLAEAQKQGEKKEQTWHPKIDALQVGRFLLAVCLCALTHDLRKMVTDYHISTMGGRFFFVPTLLNILKGGLDDFGKRHQCEALRYYFIRGRSIRHEDYLGLTLKTYLGLNPKQKNYLDGECEYFMSNFYHELCKEDFKYSRLYSLLKAADGLSCCESVRLRQSLYPLSAYLTTSMAIGNIPDSTDGFYHLEHGYFVEYYSRAYMLLLHASDLHSQFLYKAQNLQPEDFMKVYTNECHAVRHNMDEEVLNLERSEEILGRDFDYLRLLPALNVPTRKPFFHELAATPFLVNEHYKSSVMWHHLTSQEGLDIYAYGLCIDGFTHEHYVVCRPILKFSLRQNTLLHLILLKDFKTATKKAETAAINLDSEYALLKHTLRSFSLNTKVTFETFTKALEQTIVKEHTEKITTDKGSKNLKITTLSLDKMEHVKSLLASYKISSQRHLRECENTQREIYKKANNTLIKRIAKNG
jgi:hypothetical protein